MNKLFLSICLLISIAGFTQPTFVGFSENPVDGAAATNTADPTAELVDISAQAGDLCILYAWKRTASGAISISNTGGQSWTALTTTASANATLSANVFWCIFNGTWSAHTSVTFNATTNNNIVMVAFRPATAGDTWAVDAAQTGTFVDRAAAASFTITGWTPNHAKNVNFAAWNTDDDNTWGTLTGTNWTKTSLTAQYRNTSGSDASASFAYQLQNAAAATNNVSQTELTLGNDGGLTFAICFYEFAVSTIKHQLPLTGAGGEPMAINLKYYPKNLPTPK
jgi:hypothetical protein